MLLASIEMKLNHAIIEKPWPTIRFVYVFFETELMSRYFSRTSSILEGNIRYSPNTHVKTTTSRRMSVFCAPHGQIFRAETTTQKIHYIIRRRRKNEMLWNGIYWRELFGKKIEKRCGIVFNDIILWSWILKAISPHFFKGKNKFKNPFIGQFASNFLHLRFLHVQDKPRYR